MEPEPIPEELVAGKYRLVRVIGRGGMGAVWEGEHVTLGTRVAVKFIDRELVESKEARERFDNEARAAARLQSRYVVGIFDHGVMPDGRPFIVMEYLSGEPLEDRIEARGRLSLLETATIIGQVARALEKAHSHGIIHRDLKPDNIFLTRSPDDDDEVAKVVDFGIAKFTASAPGLSSSTRTGTLLGTPFYMSPEQARGLKDIDARSDLWALGVLVYRCVVGVLPFEGVAVGDILVKICTQDPRPPSSIDPSLPATFDAWFSRAVAREPNERFASAKELAAELLVVAGVVSSPDQAFPVSATSGSAVATPSPSTLHSPQQASSKVELGTAATQMGTTSPVVPHPGARRSGGVIGALVAVIGLLSVIGGVAVWRIVMSESESPTGAANGASVPLEVPSSERAAPRDDPPPPPAVDPGESASASVSADPPDDPHPADPPPVRRQPPPKASGDKPKPPSTQPIDLGY